MKFGNSMRSLLLLVFLLLSSPIVVALDCKMVEDDFWKNTQTIVIGRIVSGELTNDKYVAKYDINVTKTLRGIESKVMRFRSNIYKGLLLGESYLLFLSKEGEQKFCAPSAVFDISWLKEENRDRVDLPQKLINRVSKFLEVNP